MMIRQQSQPRGAPVVFKTIHPQHQQHGWVGEIRVVALVDILIGLMVTILAQIIDDVVNPHINASFFRCLGCR